MAVIIGGHPRSGTTLMAKLCARHPQIAMTVEFHNFAALNASYWDHMRCIRKNWYVRGMLRNAGRNSPWRARLRSARFMALYSLGLLRYVHRPIGVVEIESVLRRLFPQARLVGDKYPRYVFLLDSLVTEPGLKRVIIYRDGRDVISSMLVKIRGSWKHLAVAREMDSVAKIAQAWVRSIEAMEKHQDRLHVVRYEALVENPRGHLDALAAFLEVDPAGFQAEIVRDTSIGKYRRGLTPAELAEMMDVAGPTLARLGYT
jgi:Sulfotransferase family